MPQCVNFMFYENENLMLDAAILKNLIEKLTKWIIGKNIELEY